MMKPSLRTIASATRLLVAAAGLWCVTLPAHSAQIMVYSTDGTLDDVIAAGDGCSLREAIINAETDSKAGSIECTRGSGADTIIIPPQSETITTSAVDDDSPYTGDLDITTDITIRGGGFWSVLSAPINNPGGRIFDVHPGGHLTLDGLHVENGLADEGGAIRVAGSLNTRNVSIITSRTPSTTVAGKGGGIYIAPGASAVIDKTEMLLNETLGVLSDGGGIYCDIGCSLTITDSSLIGNKATNAGGNIYLASGATLEMRQDTIGDGSAVYGSGIYSLGSVINTFGTVVASNGAGALGDDLDCAGGTFGVLTPEDASLAPIPGSFSLIENPSVSCNVTDVVTRSTMAGGLTSRVLYDYHNLGFNGSATRAYRIAEPYYPYTRRVIPADAQMPLTGAPLCAGHADQHGRVMMTGSGCDLGAMQLSSVYLAELGTSIAANSGSLGQIYAVLDAASPTPVNVTLTPLGGTGGIGESCNPAFSVPLTFAPGQTVAVAAFDPALVFTSVALNRPARVCELSGVADGTNAGAVPGIYRVNVLNTAATSFGLASPAVGSYVDFGTAPVGTGLQRSILITPTATDWVITNIQLAALPDSEHFEIVGPAIPVGGFPITSKALGGSYIDVRCKGTDYLLTNPTGNPFGDFDSEITVTTNYGDLTWGLRCHVSHLVSLQVSTNQISEVDPTTKTVTVSLDSPNLLGPQTFTLTEDPFATAISGLDFTWLDPLPLTTVTVPYGTGTAQVNQLTLTIPTGAQSADAHFRVNDDNLVEGTETFGVSLGLPADPNVAWNPNPALSGTPSFSILDNDDPLEDVSISLAGVPGRATAGSRVYPVVTVTNVGTSDVVGVTVQLTVDPPVKILSFVLAGAECTISDNNRSAYCKVTPSQPLKVRPFGYGTPGYIADPAHPYEDGQDTVRLEGILLMAEMNEAPKLDYGGKISLEVSGAAGKSNLDKKASYPFVIRGTGLNTGGGALPLVGTLLTMGLLALRLPRRRSTGRRGRRWR